MSPSRARREALAELGEALGGEAPEQLLSLAPADLRRLTAIVKDAREEQSAALARAIDEALGNAPRLLRGPLRKVLVG